MQYRDTAAIRDIAISRDGTILASGGDDNTLILWNLPRILHLHALTYGCGLVRDYLKTNTAVEKGETPAESRCDRSAMTEGRLQKTITFEPPCRLEYTFSIGDGSKQFGFVSYSVS